MTMTQGHPSSCAFEHHYPEQDQQSMCRPTISASQASHIACPHRQAECTYREAFPISLLKRITSEATATLSTCCTVSTERRGRKDSISNLCSRETLSCWRSRSMTASFQRPAEAEAEVLLRAVDMVGCHQSQARRKTPKRRSGSEVYPFLRGGDCASERKARE